MTLKGELKHNESLSHYNTWRVGGMAERLYVPTDVADLVQFMRSRPAEEPLLWLGLGSNSLISDRGISGSVIVTQGGLNDLALVEPQLIRVEAGVSCAKMARFAARAGLAGAEFWAGIPGTMGGALRMNAGCYGSETWDRVVSVETITRTGETRCRLPGEFNVRYRQIEGLQPDEWFVAATCHFVPGDKDKALAEIKALLARRAATQPTSEYNCGSVFRNPPNDYAARLIEACGLKGRCLGGAQVSEKHANFITNASGTARAQDIEQLIQYVQATVLAQTGVELIREVHLIGQ